MVLDQQEMRRGRWLQCNQRTPLFESPSQESRATIWEPGEHYRLVENTLLEHAVLVEGLLDGYRAWLPLHAAEQLVPTESRFTREEASVQLSEAHIQATIGFCVDAGEVPHCYGWGGNHGPDYDCSGLMQAAYRSAHVLLPRDAYLQANFCEPTDSPARGDLVFFGNERVTHVGLMISETRYLHSSGAKNGHDGIAEDDLNGENAIARHYRELLRGFGRITRTLVVRQLH